jgi:hypothetical protein
MSINPNQTNVNPLTSFFTLAGAGGGGVTSISAGSNITSITGTSSVPIINAIGAVASITAGSGITVSGTSNIPIISATAGTNNATSYANPNVVTFSIVPGATGTEDTINLINPALYPDVDKLYRLTINYEYASATFTTTPSGNITVSIFNNGSPNLLLATSSVPFTANLGDGSSNIGGNLTAIFRPGSAVGGGTVALGLTSLNSTGATLTSASCVATVFAVEEITTSNNFTLITTSAGALIAPP